jgi:hypothetical protein
MERITILVGISITQWHYIICLWCYSECISTPGELEKYVRPRWESNLEKILWPYEKILWPLEKILWPLEKILWPYVHEVVLQKLKLKYIATSRNIPWQTCLPHVLHVSKVNNMWVKLNTIFIQKLLVPCIPHFQKSVFIIWQELSSRYLKG